MLLLLNLLNLFWIVLSIIKPPSVPGAIMTGSTFVVTAITLGTYKIEKVLKEKKDEE